MWLDSRLNSSAYINERLKKARIAKAKIKELSKIYEQFTTLLKQIQVAKIQSMALYIAEIW